MVDDHYYFMPGESWAHVRRRRIMVKKKEQCHVEEEILKLMIINNFHLFIYCCVRCIEKPKPCRSSPSLRRNDGRIQNQLFSNRWWDFFKTEISFGWPYKRSENTGPSLNAAAAALPWLKTKWKGKLALGEPHSVFNSGKQCRQIGAVLKMS